MSGTSFDRVISEHLALCERNKRLDGRMPLDRYRGEIGGGSPPEERDAVTRGRETWLDHESFWDTSLERPLPEFDWGDD
ncbi:MAG TPA: hypothetical protein VJ814_03540 [Gaiellaceae bacterium]|nr:hypothetical protein [Gaiellaceae bacterium]